MLECVLALPELHINHNAALFTEALIVLMQMNKETPPST